MTTPGRTPGKPGRRSPKRAPVLKLGPLLTGTVPDHPVSADYLAAMGGGWHMLGNNAAGDCVAVTWANIRRLVTKTLGGTELYPSQDEVWAVYRTQNPSFDPAGAPDVNGPGSPADGGMDIQTLLEYLVTTGGPDGVKALGFAAVDPANPDEVKAAIAIFGCVWTGINVLDVNMQQFSAGQPWDNDPAGQVDGGHSVITAGYGTPGAGPLGGDERFITWAAETSFTDAFWASDVEECFVAIWPEHLGTREFLEGVDIARLAAGYKAITGRDFPASVPAPSQRKEVPMSLLSTVEARIGQYWHEVTGEARADLEKALAAAKAEEGKLAPLVGEARTDLEAIVAEVEPEIKAAVSGRLAQLVKDVEALLAAGL